MMNIERINDLAKEHFNKKNFEAARQLLDRPDLPIELIPNLAKCYYYTKRADKALELLLPLEKNEELWIDIALYYTTLGQQDKAFKIYQSLDQTNPKVQFNMGWHYLRHNKFQKGFEYIQHGDKCRVWGTEYLYLEQGVLNKENRWNGEFTEHLLMILEGGLGDEIIFLRWADYLKTKCNTLTILCNHSLVRLLINAGYNAVPAHVLESIPYTSYVPAMSLPAIAKFESPKQHAQFPYIKSFTDRYIVKQMDMLANGKKKIGVKFFGNPEFEHDQFRTPPRDALEGLSEYGQLFSLQLDDEENKIPNCRYLINDWQDTYSVFKGLDLLVTSCTSTAHLAGAMGIPAIVLVPLLPYFVWASESQTWYPDNINIIRQTKYNDWSESTKILYDEVKRILYAELI